jgi:transporter family protein
MNHWMFWSVLSAVFAALTAILAKLGLQTIHADWATWIRTVVILIALSGFVYGTGATSAPSTLSPRTLGFLVGSGLATGASWLFYFRALKLGEAAKVAAVDKLSVVLVALFAVVFLGERPSPREWSGIAMIGLGAVLLALKK